MRVNLKYGRSGLTVDLPETPGFLGVLTPAEVPPLEDSQAELQKRLAAPIAAAPLAQLARGKKNACIVVSDITRPVPNRILLPPILDILEENGIARENITILVATGIHRPNEGTELEQLVGKEIAGRYRVVNHFSKRIETMAYVGTIGDRVPVYVNRLYYEADLKILTGFIEPHMWAGYSGGRKSILPGISSIETLQYMHGPEMIAHPLTTYGVLEGNPFHEAGLAIMARAGADFIVNVTLNPAKAITGIFAGDPVQAHLQGCAFLARHCVHELAEPLDFILTTNAGAPLDCNLYQSVKGMTAAAKALKPGGVVVIATACSEGVGSPEYRELLELVDTPAHFLERLSRREFFIPDQWCAQETYQVMLRNPIWVYSGGIAREQLEKYHFKALSSLESALAQLFARFGPDARWAVVPDGPMIILQTQAMSN
jgi:nickel-dependent lactate racemase